MAGERRGIILREAHFPDKAPIDAYGNGGFRFAGMSHRGSILILPSGIHGWDVDVADVYRSGSLDAVLEQADGIEILLVGTGADMTPVPQALRRRFRERGVSADAMATGPAVRTYNVLLSEDRAVAAALVAVENP